MPYKKELANKSSHLDIINNPDVSDFLKNCKFLREPSDDEIADITGSFYRVDIQHLKNDPLYLIATDGSYYESSITDKFPNTKVAYVKFGTILIKLSEYRNLNHESTHLLDPFKVAALEDNNRAVTLTLPSANVTLEGKKSVVESFRFALDQWFKDERTTIDDSDPDSSLIFTLADLESRRRSTKSTPGLITVHKCPTCKSDDHKDLQVPIVGSISCPNCNAEIYPTDCLRLWEELSEYQSNGTVLGRLMILVEHLLPVHYCRYLIKHNPEILQSTVFFVDGPLALFGTAAWLHGPIMQFYDEMRMALKLRGFGSPIMIGLQKSGQVNDFCAALNNELPNSSLLLLNDKFRYSYVLNGRKPAELCFGDETYYGQDFIFKSESGRYFVFGLPYEHDQKRPLKKFLETKDDPASYINLDNALSIIQTFESDLYENAVVPITLAHKYTSISLSPGGRILDILSRSLVKSAKA
jgi:hypothetical protein